MEDTRVSSDTKGNAQRMVHMKRASLYTTYAELRLGEAQSITCLAEGSQYKFLGVMGSDLEEK